MIKGLIEAILRPAAGPEILPGGSMQPPRRGGGDIGLAMLEPQPGDGESQQPLMPKSGRFGMNSVISKINSGVSGLRDLVLRRKS